MIIDGGGGPAMSGNVAIQGDTIAYVGRAPVVARRVIDAKGAVVAPGFIDMHGHSEYSLGVDGRGLSKITQGVTTEVLGEHLSAGPVLGPAVDDSMMVAPPIRRTWTTLGGFFDYLQHKKIGMNVLSFVGAGQVRASVVGYQDRPVTRAEIEQEKKLVADAMAQGAFGLSAGFDYVPNSFQGVDEIVALAKVAAEQGGIYASHMRWTIAGLDDTIRIAREARIPVEIFHINSTMNMDADGYIAKVEAARDEGLDITANAYPYTAGWTYLKGHLPEWAREGTPAEVAARLKQPTKRARVLAELHDKPHADWDAIFVSSRNPDFDGKSVAEIGRIRNTSGDEALVDAIIDSEATAFYVGRPNPAREALVARVISRPWVDIGSDGLALPAGVHTAFGKPHPRSYGAHARVLAEYVRKQRLFSLSEAVRKMTSQPANRLGIADRGLVRQGFKADLVVFDPDTVQDNATIEQPERYASGVSWVFVNGVAVVADNLPTDALPGRVLRGPGYKPGTGE
ncbi:MAG: amidohydrolase family protein [Pseudoxanthomonas sp.]